MDSRALSYFAFPVGWVLVFLPRVYALVLTMRANKGKYDYINPRHAHEALPNDVVRGQIERAIAAHNNGMENLPLFGLAIIFANQAGVAARDVNTVVILWLVCRALFNIIYIQQRNSMVAHLRSTVFHIASFANLSLFIRAGLKMT